MLNRGETREDHGNAKCTGQQRREDKTGDITRSRKHNYVVRLLGSQSTIFRAPGWGSRNAAFCRDAPP
jgi:hypothetical protein